MLAFRFGKTAGGQCVAAGNAGDICHCAAATVGIESDSILVRCRRCILLEDSLDLHIAVRHEELIILDAHAAADDLPLLEAVARVWRSGQGDLRTDYSFCGRCRSRSVAVIGDGDGMLGRCRRCILLEDSLDLHIAVRQEELIVLDSHAAADDLPLLEAVARVWRSGQGDLRADYSLCRRCGSRSVAVRFHGDGVLGYGGLCTDGEVVLRLAAVVPRAVQRHLGGFFRVKALVARCEGVGMDIVGIAGGVVRVLRKLLRFVLARPMGKPRQLLFAAVIGAVRQPLHRQKPVLIAISKIILAAESAFAVFVKAMVNARFVDGAAADGDVFRRNTGQVFLMQVVIDKLIAVSFRVPEGFHRAVHDLNMDLQRNSIVFPNAGNIVRVLPQRAALCGHIAAFDEDLQCSSTLRGVSGTNRGTESGAGSGDHLAICDADGTFTRICGIIASTDGRPFGSKRNVDLAALNVDAAEGSIFAAADGVIMVGSLRRT